MFRVRMVLILALFILPSSAASARDTASSREEIGATLDRIVDRAYQSELPALTTPDDSGRDGDLRTPSIIIPESIMRVLWIIGIALVLVWLIQPYLMQVLPGTKEEEAAPPSFVPGAAPIDLPLPDHAELALAHRFAEAIHVLFLKALLMTALRLKVPLPKALTGREALRRWQLDEQQRDDLQSLATVVEHSHFGDRDVDYDDYLTCRDHYLRIKRALRSGA